MPNDQYDLYFRMIWHSDISELIKLQEEIANDELLSTEESEDLDRLISNYIASIAKTYLSDLYDGSGEGSIDLSGR